MTDGSDLAWLGLERHGDGRWSFDLTTWLTRFDGKLYGGTGIAATVAAMEAETARDAVWATVQFAASADLGDTVELHVEELARGRNTSQVRITATVGERIVLAAIGSTGVPRTGAIEVQVGEMPDAGVPGSGEEWGPRSAAFLEVAKTSSWLSIADMRQVELADGRLATWARLTSRPMTRAAIGFLADMVPASVARAAGQMGGGTSLDNAVRFGPPPDTEWILLEFDPHFATSGYLHGAARVWSPDGTLLAVASQSASAMIWSGDGLPGPTRS